MIFHITQRSRWETSQHEGQHTGSTLDRELADEGFIHCSTADQTPATLARFYSGVPDLVILHIDEELLDSPLVYERAADAADDFPHVYGPINLPAVVRVEPVRVEPTPH